MVSKMRGSNASGIGALVAQENGMAKQSLHPQLAFRPFFALGYCDRIVPATTPNLANVRSWRLAQYVYANRECDRCDGTKPIASETLWCSTCNALPACDECGMPNVDGCGDACGVPVPRWTRGYDAPYEP